MSQQRLKELREQLFHLERQIKPLEWDANRNQINSFKKVALEKLKKEQATLFQELKELTLQMQA